MGTGLSLIYLPATGFCAQGASPLESGPTDWLAWHFTDIGNIVSIAETGTLVSHSASVAHIDVADAEIKRDRLSRVIDLPPPYPSSAVGDHVPFYFTPRSPMLFRVKCERGQDSLVFFGVRVGDIAGDGYTWCAANGNARSQFTEFSNELASMDEFIDMDALNTKYWNSDEDPDLRRRRQSELLVRDQVALPAVSYVVCKTDQQLSVARAILAPYAPAAQFLVLSSNYFWRFRVLCG